MSKKIVAVMVALLSCLVLSLAAFAALPAPSYDSSIVGSKPITTDTLISAIYHVEHKSMVDDGDDEEFLAEHTLESVAARYTCTSLAEQYAVTATNNIDYNGSVCRDGFMAWYDADGNLCVDYYSSKGDGAMSYYRAGSSGSSAGGSGGSGDSGKPADLAGVIGKVGTGVGGVFSMSKSGFDFITKNDLCMFMVSISFAGIALGFVKRAFKTAKK